MDGYFESPGIGLGKYFTGLITLGVLRNNVAFEKFHVS